MIHFSFSLIFAQTEQVSVVKAKNSQNDLSQKLDDFFTRSTAYGFSGSVIIAKGNQVLLRKGYGLIDRQRDLPVTTETVFSIASLDKQFIAACVLKLEEAGKLKVTDSITKFFDFVPEDKKNITVHQLLSHTSGIPDDYWDEHKEMSRAEYVRYVLNKVKLSSSPGTHWEYTNAGFIILEEIVARASGKPYEEFIHEAILDPARLTNTDFPSRKWNPDTVAKYRLWTMDIDKSFVDATDVLKRPRPLWVMLSTVDDFYKWYLALKGDKILSVDSKKKLFTPVLENYGYGWNIVPTLRGTKLIHHGGSGSGVGMNATFRWFADEGIFVGILSNSTNQTLNSDYFMADVEMVLFGETPNQPPTPDIFSPPLSKNIFGKYKLANGADFEIVSAIGNRLVIKSFDPRVVTILRFPNSIAPPKRVPQDEIANEIIRGAMQNDFEPLRKQIASPEDFEVQKKRLQNGIARFIKMGKVQNVSTVHQRRFNRENKPELQSFIQLQFEKEKAVIRFVYMPNGGFNYRRINMEEGIESLLVPIKENEFATWDFTLNTSAKLIFSEDNSTSKIIIQSPYGEVVATKK